MLGLNAAGMSTLSQWPSCMLIGESLLVFVLLSSFREEHNRPNVPRFQKLKGMLSVVQLLRDSYVEIIHSMRT